MIKNLFNSKSIGHRTDEAVARTILDLILIDRLNHLENQKAYYPLLLSAEVAVNTRFKNQFGKPGIFKGRADWALGYGQDKKMTGSILVIVEAKPQGNMPVGLPQLLVYMVGVQQARKGKENTVVWGMVSDSLYFTFACLDENQKFLTSPTLEWRINHEDILRHIDTILLDAINSSPNTTPVKSSNSVLRQYRPYLEGSWQFGDESDEDMEEEPVELVDVIKRDGDVITIETGSAF